MGPLPSTVDNPVVNNCPSIPVRAGIPFPEFAYNCPDIHFLACMNARAHSFHRTACGQYLRSVWQVEGPPAYRQETILPKGVLELIFSFSGAVQFSLSGEKVRSPRCFINGMTTRP